MEVPAADPVVRLAMVAAPARFTAERKLEAIVAYILKRYRDARHVRRAVSWLGFVALGLEKLVGPRWGPSWSRHSVRFRYRGRAYQVKFRHDLGRRGAIVISELRAGRLKPAAAGIVATIGNLREAEAFYLDAASFFERSGLQPQVERLRAGESLEAELR